MGGATEKVSRNIIIKDISIHAPRGGSDASFFRSCSAFNLFQSTLPVGGATIRNLAHNVPIINFNPRSPWGERLDEDDLTAGSLIISIHAPRGGSDHKDDNDSVEDIISIHAPRGGSDLILITTS